MASKKLGMTRKRTEAPHTPTKGFLVWDSAETGWLIIVAKSHSHARTLYTKETGQPPPWYVGHKGSRYPVKLFCRRAPAYDNLQLYGAVPLKEMIPEHYMAAINEGDGLPNPLAMPRAYGTETGRLSVSKSQRSNPPRHR